METRMAVSGLSPSMAEKTATRFITARMRFSRQSRLRRTAGLSALTVVVSKKASIGARRRASAVIAAAKSSAASAGPSAASAASRAAKRARSAVGLGEAGVGVERVFDAVLLLLLGQDVGRALVAGEQVGAVVGGEEVLQGADAGDEQHEVVLAAELEAGVDDVVADALAAEVDLEAIGEEGEEIGGATSHQPSTAALAINNLRDRTPLLDMAVARGRSLRRFNRSELKPMNDRLLCQFYDRPALLSMQLERESTAVLVRARDRDD